jgi:hypothetical protein
MIGELRNTLEHCNKTASLCWFGDHVPIMPDVYSTFGVPNGEVEYCVWSNRRITPQEMRSLSAQDLSLDWLRFAGIIS